MLLRRLRTSVVGPRGQFPIVYYSILLIGLTVGCMKGIVVRQIECPSSHLCLFYGNILVNAPHDALFILCHFDPIQSNFYSASSISAGGNNIHFMKDKVFVENVFQTQPVRHTIPTSYVLKLRRNSLS